VLERAGIFGRRETRHGVRLIGFVPHVAPEAWFHAIPRGLSDAGVIELETALGRPVPGSYRRLLQTLNGGHFFSGALAIYGARSSAGRDVDDAFLPFDVVKVNHYERPHAIGADNVIVGGYRLDGSLVLVSRASGATKRVDRSSGSPLNVWDSLDEFLEKEITRLDTLHDASGRLIADKSELLPPVAH
jgi:hypothetical protein